MKLKQCRGRRLPWKDVLEAKDEIVKGVRNFIEENTMVKRCIYLLRMGNMKD